MQIKEQHFLITGANRGIGLAVAEMAAQEGAHLHLVMRQTDLGLRERMEKLGAASTKLIAADLSQRQGVQQLLEELQETPVDILFNNAGQLTGGLLEEQPLDDIYSMLQVNISSLIHLTRGLLPGMIKRGRGKIINNSSVSAIMHFPCATTYAASKAAVLAFTDCLEAELKGTGVDTLCLITPGIKTRMFDDIPKKYGKNFDVPLDSITPENYAQLIKEAILKDEKYFLPKGKAAMGLFTARHFPQMFSKGVNRYFRR
jgi:uncharacterized protein